MNRQRLVWFLSALLVLCVADVASATSKTFTFTNKEGQDADDLHVELKQASDPVKNPTTRKFGEFTNHEATSGNNHKFDGGTVKNNKATSIEFDSTSSRITVKTWWWSKGGRRLGSKKTGNPQ